MTPTIANLLDHTGMTVPLFMNQIAGESLKRRVVLIEVLTIIFMALAFLSWLPYTTKKITSLCAPSGDLSRNNNATEALKAIMSRGECGTKRFFNFLLKYIKQISLELSSNYPKIYGKSETGGLCCRCLN